MRFTGRGSTSPSRSLLALFPAPSGPIRATVNARLFAPFTLREGRGSLGRRAKPTRRRRPRRTSGPAPCAQTLTGAMRCPAEDAPCLVERRWPDVAGAGREAGPPQRRAAEIQLVRDGEEGGQLLCGVEHQESGPRAKLPRARLPHAPRIEQNGIIATNGDRPAGGDRPRAQGEGPGAVGMPEQEDARVAPVLAKPG